MISLLLTLVALSAPQDPARLRGGPLHYDEPATAGLVEQVQARLESGELELAFDPSTGYLADLLKALEIPVSSQGLVFSKTSFQDRQISPQTPRAVYFGDEAYVGSIPGTPLIEVTSMDPVKGPVFYTLGQDAKLPPRLVRRHDECLTCHAGSPTRGWPGHLARSVHPDERGYPILRSGTERVTHATPFEKRWGGWYVTGTHGDARHRGNTIADEKTEMVDPEPGANLLELDGFFATERYLSPHSDIVALMVLEHQTEMHNLIARANYEVQLALHRQAESNRILGDPPDSLRDSTKRILDGQASKLLEYMLFKKEAQLPAPIRGTSSFTAEFQKLGPTDDEDRSLRALDLEKRLFRYPCSYVIHSPAFNALPPLLLEVVYRKLWEHLTTEPDAGRRAVLEILRATKPDLPEYWLK